MPPRPPLFMRSPHIHSSLQQLRLRRPASNSRNRRGPTPEQAAFGRPSLLRERWRTQTGFRFGVGLGVVSLGFIVWNLESVPVSGRWRFNCVPASIELRSGAHWYKQIIQQYEGRILPETHPHSRMVNRVMERLVAGWGEGEWEAVVIDDDETANAFVLPGGKVFVFSGFIPFCDNDDGLASILGHEIAHNIAHHAGESMSTRWILIALAYAISVYFNLPLGLIDRVLDIGYQKPGSRRQESEADYIGFLVMARACYRLEEAAAVRERVMKSANDQWERTPQFLSTHPSEENRAKKFAEWLPKASEVQAMVDCGGVMEHVDGFRRAFEMQAQTDDDGFW